MLNLLDSDIFLTATFSFGVRRLCNPYVTWALLKAEFGELAADVAAKYFTETPAGRYAFRPAYRR